MLKELLFQLQDYYLLWWVFPDLFIYNDLLLIACPQPQQRKLCWFGLIRFRSPLLTESNFFLFLRVLRCFSSPGSLQLDYVFI